MTGVMPSKVVSLSATLISRVNIDQNKAGNAYELEIPRDRVAADVF